MLFSVSINHQQAHPVIQLKDNSTKCTATIFSFGGFLNAFSIPLKNNTTLNCVEGFSSVSDARKNIANSFSSAKLSPFVCRMRNGSFSWEQKPYKVHKHYLGAHAIHGLVYDLVYNIAFHEATDQYAKLILEQTYKATDQGYPFPYTLKLEWILFPNNTLQITTTAIHNNPTPIPFADGWHPYFSLGGKVDTCTLQMTSNEQLVFDKALLPTGKTKPDHRFLKGRSLKGIFLDNSFVLNPDEKGRCTLQNKQAKLTITPSASYPILQVYTPLHRKSIAIENLSGAPDNFNNGIGLVHLAPNQPYTFTTAYQLTAL